MTELDPLREAMARAGIDTMKELAEKSGLSHATLYRMFEDTTTVSLKAMRKLGDGLGIPTLKAQTIIAEMRRAYRAKLKAKQAQEAEVAS